MCGELTEYPIHYQLAVRRHMCFETVLVGSFNIFDDMKISVCKHTTNQS